jgi:hypothetical protein
VSPPRDSALTHEDRVVEWLDWIFKQESSRRGALPDIHERRRIREKLMPMATRLASGNERAFNDILRLYGRLRQGSPRRVV